MRPPLRWWSRRFAISRNEAVLRCWSPIGERLSGRVPILLPARPVRLCNHHASDRVSKALAHCAMRLLARTHAFEPVCHVAKCQVVNAHWRERGFARQQHVFRSPLLVDIWIVFVRALLFDQLIPRAALAAKVE